MDDDFKDRLNGVNGDPDVVEDVECLASRKRSVFIQTEVSTARVLFFELDLRKIREIYPRHVHRRPL